MTITITTSSNYRFVVIEILQSMELLPHDVSGGGREIVLQFKDEFLYRAIAGWGADALACGLIFGFQVER